MSLKGSEYETAEEASFRLRGTVVLYEKKPVYITNVTQDAELPKGEIFRVYSTPLPYNGRQAENADRRFISSGGFDLTPVKLGFLNHDGSVFYLTRSSARQNRQGLSENTLGVQPLLPDNAGRTPQYNQLIAHQGFADTILGVYPTLEQGLAELKQPQVKAIAIARDYALVNDENLDGLVILYHKLVKVGYMVDDSTKTFRVGSKFKFLKEELRERNIRSNL